MQRNGGMAVTIAVLLGGLVGCSEPFGDRQYVYQRGPSVLTVSNFYTGSGAQALAAPGGLTFDGSGNLYVADTGNGRIVRLSPTGTFDAEVATGLSQPGSLSYHGGFLYFTEVGSNDLARIDLSDNTVVTLVTGLSAPYGVSVDSTGTNLYMSEFGQNVVYGRPLSNITAGFVVASTGAGGYADGSGNGTYNPDPNLNTLSLVNAARGVAVDASATYLYVADCNNHAIRRVLLSTLWMDTIGGHTPAQGAQSGSVDGPVGTSMFFRPTAVAVRSGNVYVTDTNNNSVRMISSSLNTTTLATGLNQPSGIAVGPDGSVYVADTGNNRIVAIRF